MALTTNNSLLLFAEGLDALRVVPRLILGSYAWLVWDLISWFKSIPDPTDNQMWLVTTISGLSSVIIGLYLQSGRIWSDSGNVSWKKPQAAPVVFAMPQPQYRDEPCDEGD